MSCMVLKTSWLYPKSSSQSLELSKPYTITAVPQHCYLYSLFLPAQLDEAVPLSSKCRVSKNKKNCKNSRLAPYPPPPQSSVPCGKISPSFCGLQDQYSEPPATMQSCPAVGEGRRGGRGGRGGNWLVNGDACMVYRYQPPFLLKKPTGKVFRFLILKG
jgi:hypothetical protein